MRDGRHSKQWVSVKLNIIKSRKKLQCSPPNDLWFMNLDITLYDMGNGLLLSGGEHSIALTGARADFKIDAMVSCNNDDDVVSPLRDLLLCSRY